MKKLSSSLLRNDVRNVKWSKPSSTLMNSSMSTMFWVGHLWLFYTSHYRISIPCHLLLTELNLLFIDLISFGTLPGQTQQDNYDVDGWWYNGADVEDWTRWHSGGGDIQMKALYCQNWLTALLMLFLSLYPSLSQCSPWFHLVCNIESHWPCPESSPSKCPDRFKVMHHPSESVLNCSCQEGPD